MSTRLFAAAAALTLFVSAAPAVDPELAGLVMPGAKVLAGVNAEQLRTTPFGQFLLGRLDTSAQELQTLADTTNLDPRRDVREVLVASTGETANRHGGLVLVRGTFDVAKISAAAQAKGKGPESYNGATLFASPAKSDAVAFLSPSVAIIGRGDEVRAAIDRRSAPTSLDPALAVKVNTLSTTRDAWLVSLVPPPLGSAKLPDPTLQGLAGTGFLQGIQQSSVSVKFGANVDVAAEAVAASAQDANTLATLVRMLATMAQANSRGTPSAALLQSLTVTTTGTNTVLIGLSIPESAIEQLIDKPKTASRRRL
jgi:hypothetical protein